MNQRIWVSCVKETDIFTSCHNLYKFDGNYGFHGVDGFLYANHKMIMKFMKSVLTVNTVESVHFHQVF